MVRAGGHTSNTSSPPRLRRACGLLLVGGLLMGLSGCGTGGSEASAALVSGLPKCDPSLLHPRISVGGSATLPGKLVVYVDGVMACIDDAARVDQIVGAIEGRTPSGTAGATGTAPSTPTAPR